MKKCVRCIDALSVGTRLKIIRRLRKRPQNVSEIEESFNLTQPTISYHLGVLKKAGLLKAKKLGRETYYSLNEKYSCKNCIIPNI
ncbi:MAG: putative arsenical resistance operon repressor [Parcubacteria group bacterium Gr01-1014_30]|nr:MAG: putative arsenical resistance operon repressor [Parcubacteria group bacterium Gr01-1014_30]